MEHQSALHCFSPKVENRKECSRRENLNQSKAQWSTWAKPIEQGSKNKQTKNFLPLNLQMLCLCQLIFTINPSSQHRIQRRSQKKCSVCFTQNSPCMVISSVCLSVMQRLLSRLQSQYSIIHPIVFFISHSMDGWAAGERSFFCGREGGKSIAFI